MILGTGPSNNLDTFKDFNGLKLASDRQYHNLVKENIHPDYLITLEDEDLAHYFTSPHLNPKPVVVTSIRTTEKTKNILGDEDFLIKIFTSELINVCYNVGMMGWMYAWMKLGAKEVHLNVIK